MSRKETLRILRLKNNLTQQDVADKLGISITAYSLIENGKRVGSTKVWIRLQELFKLPDDEIWRLQKNK